MQRFEQADCVVVKAFAVTQGSLSKKQSMPWDITEVPFLSI